MPAVERQANLILGEDKIGFIFLDCRGNTPGGKSTSTAGPGTGQRKQKNFNHFATVQEQLNDYSMPSWKPMKTLLFKGSQKKIIFLKLSHYGNGAVGTPILLLPPHIIRFHRCVCPQCGADLYAGPAARNRPNWCLCQPFPPKKSTFKECCHIDGHRGNY